MKVSKSKGLIFYASKEQKDRKSVMVVDRRDAWREKPLEDNKEVEG